MAAISSSWPPLAATVPQKTKRRAMSPEALALAEKRIEMEMQDRTREFARAAADKHEEVSMRGLGMSSMLILSIHDLARTELEDRARSALAVAQRAFTADDAEPSDELRTEVTGLIDRAVRELSSDVDAVYEKHCSRMQGKWPTLKEPRQRALDLATSDLDVDLLARRRRRVSLGDVLKAPRYQACREHWLKARGLVAAEAPDIENAIKEGVTAVEALAKIVAGGGTTLGDCIKTLRAERRIDPGTDNILKGLWTFANSAPGVRHGSSSPSSLGVRDWQVFGPMVDGALTLLLSADNVS